MVPLCEKIIAIFFHQEVEGATRTKKRLLIFPKTIKGETRCCGWATWEERLVVVHQPVFSYLEWEPTRWL